VTENIENSIIICPSYSHTGSGFTKLNNSCLYKSQFFVTGLRREEQTAGV
jgi:hypothetical protein